MATEATYPRPAIKVEVKGPSVRKVFELQVKTWGVDSNGHGTVDTWPLQVNFNCPVSGDGVMAVMNWKHGAIRFTIDNKYEVVGGTPFFNKTDSFYTAYFPARDQKPTAATIFDYVKCDFKQLDRTTADFQVTAKSDKSGEYQGSFLISFMLHYKPVSN